MSSASAETSVLVAREHFLYHNGHPDASVQYSGFASYRQGGFIGRRVVLSAGGFVGRKPSFSSG